MKYMIISDIHGAYLETKQIIEQFKKINAQYLIILGDILYHGPRNVIPEGYNPQATVSILNEYKDCIIAVRGNCDAEVDQMVLSFPCMSDYAFIVNEGQGLFATHGHIYHNAHMPPLASKSIFLSGHTHLWTLEKKDSIIFCNPGSISLPKENRKKTYALYSKEEISIHLLDGQKIASMKSL